jgi:ubiquinone/menaquinone biosynthesis C-methylase UbiE
METFLNPEKVLSQIEVRRDMVAAEFGCGSGGFALPLAKKIKDGLVYGLDIQQAPLNVLKSRTLFEKLVNVRVIRCDLEKPRGSTLPSNSLDLVLIPNVLFQAEDKIAIMTEANRVLKNGGKAVVIDWLPGVLQGPGKGRISAEEVKKIAESLGLKPEKEIQAGVYHYGLVFVKP